MIDQRNGRYPFFARHRKVCHGKNHITHVASGQQTPHPRLVGWFESSSELLILTRAQLTHSICRLYNPGEVIRDYRHEECHENGRVCHALTRRGVSCSHRFPTEVLTLPCFPHACEFRDSSAKRAFQTLPRHLRRRAASHNARRVPGRLRSKAAAEVHISCLVPRRPFPWAR